MVTRQELTVEAAVSRVKVCIIRFIMFYDGFNSSSKLSYNNNQLPYSSSKDRTSRKTSDSKDRLDIESKLQIP